jgi:non-ribosomal peptide synthetase-like protein
LFEAKSDQFPSNIAVYFGEESWTYRQLEQRANQLARYLRTQGIGPGSLVGIYFNRSEKPIIAILATLKAGAGYVPIDPATPPERVRQIMTDSNAAALLTDDVLSNVALSIFLGRCINVDCEGETIAAEAMERLSSREIGVSANDLAYVLFTSGTTGHPKGVMIEHRNVVGFITGWNRITQIHPMDRVYQGFSLGFDASVEELWMAFSNGAALVIAPTEVVRVPDEVAKLVKQRQVTVISLVPTFLSLLDAELPTLRIVISGGEPCPNEIVRRWYRPGRRFFNTYGPTETTVDATYLECTPERPVTIGRPLPGYEVYVLDKNLRPVSPGEPGELCIGGVAVARGYLNRDELTCDRFVTDPFREAKSNQARLYRSGDLVRLLENGELEFLGRLDRQVKIRGYRIELAEIEAVLHEHPQIQQAVVDVVERQDVKELVAYVVPRPRMTRSFDRDNVLQLLRKRLPSYMVPVYLEVIDSIPTLSSGKVDRGRLPAPSAPLISSRNATVGPRSALERKIITVWRGQFKLTPISCEDDFFLDLGGHSLLAAEMVSVLRSDYGLTVAIRDVYEYPTVSKLAAHIASVADTDIVNPTTETRPTRRTSREVSESAPRLMRWTCYVLQAVSLVVGYGLVSAPLAMLSQLVLGVIQGTVSLAELIAYTMITGLIALPTAIGISIILKWLIIRRYKPGEYPLWSFYYFRWWLATRVQSISGIAFFTGTPIMSLYYRLMGAKIGKNCILDTSLCVIHDLLTIGDDTCIGSRTQLLGYHVEDGLLKIGSIEIGSRCFIGSHSAIGINTKMGDDCALDDLSLLPDGGVMNAGESQRGSPAEAAEVSLPEFDETANTSRGPWLAGLLFYLGGVIIVNGLLLAFVLPLLAIAAEFSHFGAIAALVAVYLWVPINVVAFCIASASIKALIMRHPRPGVYSVESLYFLRRWLVELVFRASGRIMYPMYATIYILPWLRLMGAKIGRRAEVAMVGQLVPDLMIIGDESFLADGSTIGGRRFFRGCVQLGISRIGRRTFLGNSSLLPTGTSLGDGSLLGVLSLAPGSTGSSVPDGTEWLGSPPFQLPHRKPVEGFDVSHTYRPTFKLYVLRYFIDAIRILLPFYIGLTGLLLFGAFAAFAFLYLPVWSRFVLLPIVSISIACGAALSVVVVKKLLIGIFKPAVKPLWSVYVWFNEVINGVYETIGAPILTPTMGTPFFSWYLRLLGCKIGKHSFIHTTHFSEFDLVEIGDHVALNFGAVVQNHLFEDRIMKSSYVKIGDECSVANMSVVLYDTEMKCGSSIAPLSLLMKGETLPPHTTWIGIPTRQANDLAAVAVASERERWRPIKAA